MSVYGAGTRLVGNPGQRPPTPSPRLSWLHPVGLIGLSIVNFALRIVTLGIYHFWGKTEVRRRIWSAIRLDGEPLEYTGLGKELFLGFLIVFALVLLPIILGSFGMLIAFGPQSPALAVFQMVIYVAFIYLLGVAIYRAQRYRMSRTRWRGIRGAVVGNSWGYGWTYFWTALLVPLTLGWIAPWRSVRLQKLLTDDMRFGSRPFQFTGTAGALYGRYVVLWFGIVAIGVALVLGVVAIVTEHAEYAPNSDEPFRKLSATGTVLMVMLFIGAYLMYAVVSAWYRAGMINHFATHTFYEGARFRGSVTAGGLIWIAVTNFLITLLSLGLLTPVAQARAARYLVENLAIEGAVPFAEIAQSAHKESALGEGLAQAFDVDAF